MPKHSGENDAVIAGTHPVLDDQAGRTMMSIARLRDGKIYRYDHTHAIRAMAGT